jgi:hypothetical protein
MPGAKPTTAEPKPRSNLAVTFGLPPNTPDNLVRMYAGALAGNNQAHTIKGNYDTNNPPPPTQRKETAGKT